MEAVEGSAGEVSDPVPRPLSSAAEVLEALGTPVAVVDADGVVNWFNRAAEEMHGWNLSRDAGRRFSDLLPSLAPESSSLQEALAAGRSWSGRMLLTRSGGATYPALLNCVPVQGDTGALLGLVASSTDLTEADAVQRRLSTGFTNSPYGWAFCDLDGIITDCNSSYAQIIGLTPEEVVGHRPDDFTYENDLDLRTPFEAMRNGLRAPTFTAEKRFVGPDGTLRWVRAHVQMVSDHAGRPEFFSGQIEDITTLVESLTRSHLVERSYRELFGQAVHSLGAALEVRDPYTAGHQHRVADLCVAIAQQMGMQPDGIEGLAVCAEMHDIGKVATPAEILTKPGRLLDAEFGLIKLHSATGHAILEQISFPWPVARAVREHHERLNGSGYPDGLRGDQICLEALILAVADTVETVASHRPYRAARPLETALEIISDSSGTLYQPDVVQACIDAFSSGYTLAKHNTSPPPPVHLQR